MKEELRGLGYSKDDIMHLTPERAHVILTRRLQNDE